MPSANVLAAFFFALPDQKSSADRDERREEQRAFLGNSLFQHYRDALRVFVPVQDRPDIVA